MTKEGLMTKLEWHAQAQESPARLRHSCLLIRHWSAATEVVGFHGGEWVVSWSRGGREMGMSGPVAVFVLGGKIFVLWPSVAVA